LGKPRPSPLNCEPVCALKSKEKVSAGFIKKRRRKIEQLTEKRQLQILEKHPGFREKQRIAAQTKTTVDSQLNRLHLQHFMGFPLAGGPDDDVSSLLSRDLFQKHLDNVRSKTSKSKGADNIAIENWNEVFGCDLFTSLIDASPS